MSVLTSPEISRQLAYTGSCGCAPSPTAIPYREIVKMSGRNEHHFSVVSHFIISHSVNFTKLILLEALESDNHSNSF